MADKRAQQILQEFDRHKTGRNSWEQHWKDAADNMLPRYSPAFYSGAGDNIHTRGGKRNDKILDATAVKGLERFAAAVEGMVTPRSQRWHRLRATVPELMKSVRVQRFFGAVEDRLWHFRNSSRANFASQMYESYLSLGCFGTGPVFIEEPRDNTVGLRYRAQNIANVYLEQNEVGIITKMYRRMMLTLDSAEGLFGRDKLPDKLVAELDKPKRNPLEEYEFVQVIRPRTANDPPALGEEGMGYASIYVSREGEQTVKTGGYYSWPMPTSRYVIGPGETYGRSVGMMALPAIKTLYEQKKTALKMGHRAVDPVLLAHDDGVLDHVDLKPGTVNYGGVSPEGRKLIQPLDNGVHFTPVAELMAMERADINDIFLVSLFQVLTENPQMTATEVIERTREKGILMAPTMGRLQSEFLGPIIERELDLLSRQAVLPEPPPELLEASGEYEIEYDSPLSKAIKADEAGGILRFMEMAGTYAQMTGDPSMFDHVEPDRVSPDLMWILGVPAKWQATPEDIEAKREQRAQQQQIQQAIEAAPAAAGVMKAAGSS